MRHVVRKAVLATALAIPLVATAAHAESRGADLAATPLDPGTATVTETGGERTAVEEATDTTLRYTAGRTVLSHPGASSVKVHINTLRLAPGDRLVVSDPAGTERYAYSVDPSRATAPASDASATLHRTRGFAAMSVEGDTAVLTIEKSSRTAAATLDRAGYGVRVDRVWRGLSDAERLADRQQRAVCGKDARRDVVCYAQSHPTEYARSKAVAKLIMNGSGACTGWRVGKTNRMLTNNHCIGNASTAKSTEVQFAYECKTCGGNDPGAVTKVAGTEMFKTNGSLDYTLFSVDKFDAISSFGTLFLDPRAPRDGEQIYIPGHGDAKVKRLSIVEEPGETKNCTVFGTSGNRMRYNCDTSGGNSGSPVLATSSHKVLSLHNTGSCPNNNGSNRMDKIFPEIQSMIDNNG
ncbi:hypothetical protein GCM10010123_02560 [Pilimelia anulata]|uniref:Serine protease n=1 Tax=Pilimelia anulata TaxID=53371 RepID=A0A8J3B3H5_9ACTN|nr:serine protease [Pilimelia anulata]GGJ76062.1 hypothetical protein GCM10010123_02560 [Pilimelia anulata]